MTPTYVVERARLFASAAHAAVGQRRKYTLESYIVHPAEVVGLVRSVQHTDEMLAAAWLHDVVEDTKVEIAQIRAEFGETVARLVSAVTDISLPEDGNRAVRKTIDRDHLACAPAQAKTIKLADLISNSRSILARDRAFAMVYIQEKAALLDVLRDGNPSLHAVAARIVADALERFGEAEQA